MKTEIEAKFLNADFDAVRTKLLELGAVCTQPMRAMRRKHFDFADLSLSKTKSGFVRLRDEGDKITLSYKQVDNLGVHGTKEVNIAVDDFNQAELLLASIGLKAKSYHETRRESWKLGNNEIELDEWPAISPLVEIEAENETQLWGIAEKLGLDKNNIMHGTADYLYAKIYDVTEDEVNAWPEITFAETPKKLAGKLRKLS